MTFLFGYFSIFLYLQKGLSNLTGCLIDVTVVVNQTAKDFRRFLRTASGPNDFLVVTHTRNKRFASGYVESVRQNFTNFPLVYRVF